MSFLTGQWRRLIMANYAIDPKVLEPYVPPGTELDLWEGTCYVSLVGFLFKDTKLLGIPIPFYRNFEEVNLRFYVRYNDNGEWKRGVTFISEIVPKFMLTLVANTVYNEHYSTKPMRHHWSSGGEEMKTGYEWKHDGTWMSLSVKTDVISGPITPGSEAEFITEHYWGYTPDGKGQSFEYEVRHPIWEVYPIQSYEVNTDFGALYGADFAFLDQARPTSVFLAEGSEISVEGKRRV
jgi:uncharacterized protein YqjF (DUF2071 family)